MLEISEAQLARKKKDLQKKKKQAVQKNLWRTIQERDWHLWFDKKR